MHFYIVIPAYNEEAHIDKTLQSLIDQSLLPSRVVVVNDGSTDRTGQIIDDYAAKYDFIAGIHIQSNETHLPGSKVINAFNAGLNNGTDVPYDIICKFDADLIFPKDYLERVSTIFSENPKCGIAGGLCTIEKNDQWVVEGLTGKAHVRGALKAYRKQCFEQIGGLKSSMGWDTLDEYLAQYNGWSVITNETLWVKHLKPTGKLYQKSAGLLQGEALYKIGFSRSLTLLDSVKLALRKRSHSFLINSLKGYSRSKKDKIPKLVSKAEEKFIRSHRWKAIRRKLFG